MQVVFAVGPSEFWRVVPAEGGVGNGCLRTLLQSLESREAGQWESVWPIIGIPTGVYDPYGTEKRLCGGKIGNRNARVNRNPSRAISRCHKKVLEMLALRNLENGTSV
jgi:hypothetical protein